MQGQGKEAQEQIKRAAQQQEQQKGDIIQCGF